VNRQAIDPTPIGWSTFGFPRRLSPIFLLVTHLGNLIEADQSSFLHRRDMHDYVFAKSKSLRWIEPLHSASCHIRSPF
jgi:hypothetical protein